MYLLKLFCLGLKLKCTVSFIRKSAGGRGGLLLYFVHHIFQGEKPGGAKQQRLPGHYFSAKTTGEKKAAESRSLKFLPSC